MVGESSGTGALGARGGWGRLRQREGGAASSTLAGGAREGGLASAIWGEVAVAVPGGNGEGGRLGSRPGPGRLVLAGNGGDCVSGLGDLAVAVPGRGWEGETVIPWEAQRRVGGREGGGHPC